MALSLSCQTVVRSNCYRPRILGTTFSRVNHIWRCNRIDQFQHSNTRSVQSHCASSARGVAPDSLSDCAKPFTITTPLFYVNAAPHMGSAYPTIAADALSRFQRLCGRQVVFLTGTDEHGEKIALAAEARGLSPGDHCDDMVGQYKALWDKLEISYDRFVRTTAPEHERAVEAMLERVWRQGDIYSAAYEGWYCVACEEYKDEGELGPGHTCTTHRSPCSKRQEENYFFKLTNYQQALEVLLAGEPAFVQPESRRNEVMGWVGGGVRDFSISRAAVEWGIPVPRDPKQTVYVWFDALTGYLSGLLPGSEAGELASLQRHGWPADVHVIGKDILRFHAVYWPAMLLAAGLPLPKKVFGHGFLTKDGLKMGKSLGNVVDPLCLVDAYGADAVRYFFMKEIDFGKDGDFSEARFRNIVNADLANDVGNLLNRTLNLLKKNCGGVVPVSAHQVAEDNPLRLLAAGKCAEVYAAYQSLDMSGACTAALAISRRGNQYLEEEAPWTALKKGSAQQVECALCVLVATLEALRIVALLLAPVTPSLSRRIYLQLGFTHEQYLSASWSDTQWGLLAAGHATAAPQPVFARLEGEYVTEPAPQQVPVVA